MLILTQSVYNCIMMMKDVLLSIVLQRSFLYWDILVTPLCWRHPMNWKMSPSLSVTRMVVFSSTMWLVVSQTTTCSNSQMMSLPTCSQSNSTMVTAIYMVSFSNVKVIKKRTLSHENVYLCSRYEKIHSLCVNAMRGCGA